MAKTVNPFSFNKGDRSLDENLADLHARLPSAAHDRDDAGAGGLCRTVHVERERQTILVAVHNIRRDRGLTRGCRDSADSAFVAEQAHTTRARSTTDEHKRVPLMAAAGRLRSRPAVGPAARSTPARRSPSTRRPSASSHRRQPAPAARQCRRQQKIMPAPALFRIGRIPTRLWSPGRDTPCQRRERPRRPRC